MNGESPFPAPVAAPDRDIYTVTRLNREAKAVLEGSFPPLWVRGEISNLARPASGHLYFSLKDAHSQVRCAMFRGRNRFLKVDLDNGMEVLARASVSLYEGRGEFQLIVEQLEPVGEGALQRAFEALKRKLAAEGLFDEAVKRPLPAFPRVIGVVTSPTGAAVRDILNVLGRRWPGAAVLVYPTPVQGAGSAEKIVEAMETAGRRAECDVLILARGGGSLEDLWSFNEEVVARAVRASPIPVVVGVGHEIDFTISDFAADRRAPTPSAAAELVSPDQYELRERLANRESKLRRRMLERLRNYSRLLGQLMRRLAGPGRYLETQIQRVDELSLRLVQGVRRVVRARRADVRTLEARLTGNNPIQRVRQQRDRNRQLSARLQQGVRHGLRLCRERLGAATHALNTVSPQATLDRGYSIVTDDQGRLVMDAGQLNPGQAIRARFARGSAGAKITDVKAKGE